MTQKTASQVLRLAVKNGKPFTTMNTPLPMRHGVGASRVWLPDGNWQTIFSFLIEYFPNVSAQSWKSRMHNNQVMDINSRAIKQNTPYQSGIHLFYYRELDTEVPIPFAETIVYENEHILIADKPHFLPVIPSGRFLQQTLLTRLRNTLNSEQLNPVHRIDKDTAGLVMFSKQRATRGAYHLLFQQRKIRKSYEAIAPSLSTDQLHLNDTLVHRSRLVKSQPFFLMQEQNEEDGKHKANTETHIRIIQQGKSYSHYHLKPITGKQHQLRVHLAALGIPIVNDSFYPTLKNPAHNDFSRPLQLLAKHLRFNDPITNETLSISSQRQLMYNLLD
jgi:tRNA pseudouridine32 synthase/23S rRNA pseudouridine746 synthase